MAKPISYRKQKVDVTPLLQNSIKQMRKEFNKRGDVLSKDLEKGASYISQLENGKIKEIEYDFLLEIFRTITAMPKDAFINYFVKFINSIISSCESKKSLMYEYWIHIFVVQDMPHSITPWIRQFIEKKLSVTGHTPEELVREINIHGGRRNTLSTNSDLIPNKAYVSAYSDRSGIIDDTFSLYVHASYRLDSNYISDILANTITSINYLNMKEIFKSLFLFESSDDLASAHEKTEKIMKDNSFYDTFEIFDSLTGTESSDITIDTENTSTDDFTFYDDLILNYREKYSELKSELFDRMDYALEHYYTNSHEYSCEVMEKILKNLNSDAGLVLALLSSSTYKIPRDNRHFFVEKYRELLKHYSE